MSNRHALLVAQRDTRDAPDGVTSLALPTLLPEAMAHWLSTAVRELDRHTPVDGICQRCSHVWPCLTCQQSEFALGSL